MVAPFQRRISHPLASRRRRRVPTSQGAPLPEVQVYLTPSGRSCFHRSMNATAASTNASVSSRPRCGGRRLHVTGAPHAGFGHLPRRRSLAGVLGLQRLGEEDARGGRVAGHDLRQHRLQVGQQRERRRPRRGHVHERRREVERRGRLADPGVPVELTWVGLRSAFHERLGCFAQFHGDARRFLVDAIGDISRDGLVAAVAVQDQETLEAVLHQALCCLEEHQLNRLGREGDRAGERHVVRGVAREQDGRNEHVGLLRDELRAFEPVEKVGANRPLVPVLFQRGHRQDHHVGARQELAHLGPCHVRQVVPDLLLMPQRTSGGCLGARGDRHDG